MSEFCETGWGAATIVVGLLCAILLTAFVIVWGTAEWNKHNAPISFRQCAELCGPAGVHRANPDFACECNETKRIEGNPSLDLRIKQ